MSGCVGSGEEDENASERASEKKELQRIGLLDLSPKTPAHTCRSTMLSNTRSDVRAAALEGSTQVVSRVYVWYQNGRRRLSRARIHCAGWDNSGRTGGEKEEGSAGGRNVERAAGGGQAGQEPWSLETHLRPQQPRARRPTCRWPDSRSTWCACVRALHLFVSIECPETS